MTEQVKAPEKERRDWIIILVILLFGFLCVILAGGWAIRFAPRWSLNTDMRSNIDPNSDFLTNRPSGFLEPLDPSILTQPAWINVFLTPGASFETRIPVTSFPSNTPPATNTIPPTNISSPTAIIPSPTNTFPYFPPPTNTPKPPPPPVTNTPVPPLIADLSITKNDGVSVYTPGGSLTYTITVINNGPDNVVGAIITDNKPTNITTWSWACTSQTGGASGCDPVAINGTDFNDTVNLPNGASIIYTVTANVSGGATGNITNTATISVPAGVGDPNTANNSSTDTDTATVAIITDLSITKTDGNGTYIPGSTITYTIVVTNNGPNDVTGATITDAKPAQINMWGWCNITSCIPVANTSSNLSDTFNLSNGASITYTVTANISASAAGSLTNTATVAVPAGYTDPNIANNSATDTDTSATGGEPDIGLPDGGSVTITPGTPLTMVFSPAIIANGDIGTPDLVYYEIIASTTPPAWIDLDWVQIEISPDGTPGSWITVFYWYNGSGPDTNTNVDISANPAICFTNGTTPATEVDNCHILSSGLYNGTGITIDVDPFVPAGTYSWIRISSPAGSSDGANVDAIQPYYP